MINNKYFKFYIYIKNLLLILFLFLTGYLFCNKIIEKDNNHKLIQNSKSNFSIILPNEWKILNESNSNSNIQFYSKSLDERQAISIFVFKTNRIIQLENFGTLGNKLFNNLGKLVSSNVIRKQLLILNRIENTYEADTHHTKLIFIVRANIGYVFMWQSIDDNVTDYLKISKTFKVNIPFFKRLLNWLYWSIVSGILSIVDWFLNIGTWFLGIVILIIGLFISYFIGKSGQLIRKGIKTKKILYKLRNDTLKKGFKINEKWHLYNKKSTLWIVLPISGWSLFYILIFLISPVFFYISLLGLVPLTLGFFGIFFAPSENIKDYF